MYTSITGRIRTVYKYLSRSIQLVCAIKPQFSLLSTLIIKFPIIILLTPHTHVSRISMRVRHGKCTTGAGCPQQRRAQSTSWSDNPASTDRPTPWTPARVQQEPHISTPREPGLTQQYRQVPGRGQ